MFARELACEFAGFVIAEGMNQAENIDLKINFYDLDQEPKLARRISWLQTSGHRIEQASLLNQITGIVDFTEFSINLFVKQGWNLDEALLLLIGSLGAMVRFALSQRSRVAAFHAASLAWEGQGLLLLGDTGAGKTTLSYICASQGFGYLTDEDSFVEEGGETHWQILGYQRRIRLDNKTLTYYPDIIKKQDEYRPFNIFNQQGLIIDLNKTRPESYVLSAPLSVVVVLRNDKNHATPRINHLDKSSARLWLLHSLEAVDDTDFPIKGLNRQGFYLVDNLLDFIEVIELKYNIREHFHLIPQALREILSLVQS